MDAFLSEQLPPDATEQYLQHLTNCLQCQAAAETRLTRRVWQAELLSPAEPQTTTIAQSIEAAHPDTRPGEAFRTEWFPVAAVPEPTESAAGSTGRVLADRFELQRIVGMGGCGTVYEAWDRVLQREVAVKVPHWSLFEKTSVRQRFAVEARAAARLSHPNIVPVYEARIEEAAGDCFLISEFVRGPSLQAWLDKLVDQKRSVPIRMAAMIVADLATGVESAHLAKVLHRDLKPSNVLLAPATDADLPFVPRITDFGLARLTEENAVATVEGSVFGSLPYMAPEQATGAKDFGPPCDVYSLGVILYEVLTGSPPIAVDSIPAMLAAIEMQPVEPLRRRRSEVPADLEAICLKCLEKRPRDRYRTAGELAVDVRRFLAGEAVSARLPGRRERIVRWVRRNPASMTVLSTLMVAVLAVVGVLADANCRQGQLIEDLRQSDQGLKSANERLGTSNNRLNVALHSAGEMRTRADQMRRQAEVQQRKTQESLYVSEFRRAMQAWEDQDLPLLQIMLDKLDQPEFGPYRGVECDWLRTKLIRPHRELMRFPRAAYALAFSHDGATLAAGGRDSLVKLVRFSDGTPVAEWETQQKEINGLAFVADGQRLWTSGDDGSLCQWDVATRRELLRLPAHAPEQAHDLLVAPPQNLLLSQGTDGRILLWDPLTGESRGELPSDGHTVIAAVLHPDGRHLVSTTSKQIFRWDLGRQKLVAAWDTHMDRPIASLISRDGRWLLVSKNNTTLEVQDATNGDVSITEKVFDNVQQFLPLNDSETFAAVDGQGALHEYELTQSPANGVSGATLKLRSQSQLIAGRIMRALPSADGDQIVTASADGRVLAWPRSTLDPRASVVCQRKQIVASALTQDARLLFVRDQDELWLLNAETLQPQRQIVSAPRLARSFCVLTDGDLLTAEQSPSNERTLVRRRSGDWKPVSECPMPPHPIGFETLNCDPALGLVFAYELNPTSVIRRVVGLNPFQEWRPMQFVATSRSFAVDPRNGRFACDDEQRLVAWDTMSRNVLWTQPHPRGVRALTASPDGRYFASVTNDRVIHVWETGTGRLVADLSGHRHQIGHLAISSNGRTLFSGDEGGEVLFWHLPTGERLGSFNRHGNSSIFDLNLSADDDRLIVTRSDSTIESIPLKPPANP